MVARRIRIGPAGATTVFGPVTMGASDNSWGGLTFVQSFAAANLSAATGTQVRLTVKFTLFNAGSTAVVYFAQQAAAGDAYDFLNTPTHITFSGGDLTGDGVILDYVSDFCTLPEAYDETKTYLCAVQFTGSCNLASTGNGAGSTGDNNYFKDPAADAATVNKTGYGGNLSNAESLITKIEIQ